MLSWILMSNECLKENVEQGVSCSLKLSQVVSRIYGTNLSQKTKKVT